MNGEQKQKLTVLLEYWIKHNEEHGDEFKEWADKADALEGIDIRGELMQACEEMGRVNVLLLRALEKLEGRQ
jgi:hypothetical protein